MTGTHDIRDKSGVNSEWYKWLMIISNGRPAYHTTFSLVLQNNKKVRL